MAFANDPGPAKEASQGGFFEDEVDGATVGTGVGIGGCLPAIENVLELGEGKRGAVADSAATGDGNLGTLEVGAMAEFE